MKKATLFILLGLALTSLSLEAVVPQKWDLRTKEDFLRGKFDGVSVASDGLLSLAPQEVKIDAPTEEFYLSVLFGADGTTYLGTGHGGKVYRIGKDGKAEVYFQAPEMDVLALTQDKKGTLYAATSPNGKIYKITEKGKGEEFFNPAEKYIWDMLFLDSGMLWVAVGEVGGLYEVSPTGEGRMIFRAAENHILCLRKSGRGDVIAGSGGNGLVYRLTPGGRASVLFETPYEEVRSLAIDGEGMIYAAASGTPTRPRKEETAAAPAPVRAEATVSVSVGSVSVVGVPGASVTDLTGGAGPSSRDSGALYRISGEGIATLLWSSTEEMVYTVLWRETEKRAIFGTGNKGRVYAVDRNGQAALLLQESSEQVYQLVPTDSKTYVLSNNPCFLGELLTEQRFEGQYLTTVLDARTLSSWGRVSWDGTADAGASVQIQTRSGNTVEPNASWSEWSPPYLKRDEQVLSPKSRFVQAKVLFKTTAGKNSPSLSRLTLFYLQTNVAPAVTRLEFLPPNEVYLKLPEQDDVIQGVERHLAEPPSKKDDLRISIPAKKAERKGFQTIVWDAGDENGDTLTYTLAMKKEGESEWRVLEDSWTESTYAFDTLSYPDGTYKFRLTVSDSPSNPAGLELTADKVSPPVVIDNSLPLVKNFTAVKGAAGLEVAFQAEDAYSTIQEVKYLVRPGEWRVVFPVDGICDSRSEAFKFTAKPGPGAENLITVRVKDSYGNVGVYRQTF